MATLRKRKYSSGKETWIIDDFVKGKRVRKVIGQCDKRTAEQIFHKYMSEKQKGVHGLIVTKNIKLYSFIKKYFEYAPSRKSVSTIAREYRLVKPFVKYFQNTKLTEIDFEDIEKYRIYRLGAVTPETINLEFRHLKAILNWALSHNYLRDNPFIKVKPINTPELDLPRFFELNDIEIVRNIFKNDSMNNLVEFYLLTGVRLNEALVLIWDDIDFRRHQIKIQSKNTKGKKHRIIYFEDDKNLISLLSNLEKNGNSKVFVKRDGGQWDSQWISKKISTKLTKNGFPWATCHTFRHTYISHLVMSGVPLTTVKEIVGHSSYTTTLKYSHLATSHKKEMIKKRPY